MLTTNQIADYYEVDRHSLNQLVRRNRDELREDGMITLSAQNFIDYPLWRQNVTTYKTESVRNVSTYSIDGVTFTINSRANSFFSKRAVLRIGMLLRDSAVAKEIRTQLLNAAESSVAEIVPDSVEKEKELLMDIAQSYSNGDLTSLLTACQSLNTYQQGRIKALKEANHILSGKVLEYGDRSKANAAIRYIAANSGMTTQSAFYRIYQQLEYKYGISLKKRRGKSNLDLPLLSFLRESEYPKLFRTIYAWADMMSIDLEALLEVSQIHLTETERVAALKGE